jgi:hypothetical protein
MIKKVCKPGEVIFREGEESTEAYFIISGRVEITICSGGSALPVARLGVGEIVGEMGLIDNKPRSASAMALIQTELGVITEEDFEREVLQQPARLKKYLGTLFERLRSMDTLLDLERSRRPATASAPKPVLPPAAGQPSCEPVVTISSIDPNPVTGEVVSVTVDRFPFRIGRDGGQWSPFFQNELLIADQNPLQISRQHASIDAGCEKCYVTDRGSRTGTVVNGEHLGAGNGAIVAELKTGENTVIFGHASNSVHRYKVTVTPKS